LLKMKKKIFPYILAALFFIIGLITLNDYGISWDEPRHFQRAQIYLNYFLTGEKDYQGLQQSRRSLYQSDTYGWEFFLNVPHGHGPLNGIMASLFNRFFYQKLGVVGDVESYHLFIILTSALLVFVVAAFATEEYGCFAGLIAGLSIALYPLFLGESHFNIKDPVETCFFSLTIYGFYKALKHQSAKWMVFSSVFAGMALSTKFNIVFIPLILLPWLLLIGVKRIFSKELLPSLLFYPLVVLLIFYLFWPYLWEAPLGNLMKVTEYYRGVGYGTAYQPEYLTFFGISTYALKWIFWTTPLVILFFSLLGIIYVLKGGRKEKRKTSFLILLWFLVPILRVTLPKMGIYGGVRQIMEYIPAMAILAGIGADWLKKRLRVLPPIFFILCFLPITLKLISIHPNENVYFNSLIGGLKGAREREVPSWGSNLGNVYRQGGEWVNQNAPPGAKLVLLAGYKPNLPETWVREDIEYSNKFRSGLYSEGEYIIGMVNDSDFDFYYFNYVKKFLKPLYTVKVDGVPLLAVWRNDWEHRKPEYQLEEKALKIRSVQTGGDFILINLEKDVLLTTVNIESADSFCCFSEKEIFFTSKDYENWREYLSVGQAKEFFPSLGLEGEGNKLTYFFAAEEAKFVKIVHEQEDSCFQDIKKISVRGIEE